MHAVESLQIKNEFIVFVCDNILVYFPGVPIFFIISGFLIYSSFERNSDNLLQYIINRAVRIFPALWICLLITLLTLVVDYNGNLILEYPLDLLLWISAQCSFLQFFNPDILSFWGTGTPNGSLWSIAVELQFYFLVPFIYWILSKFKIGSFILGSIFLVSVLFKYYSKIGDFESSNHLVTISRVSFLPYLYYFLIGIFIQKYWSKLSNLFNEKFFVWLFVYAIYIIVVNYYLLIDTSSVWNMSPGDLVADLLLSGLILSFAFSFKDWSKSLLKGQDISYGMYIYHMLVINFLVHRAYVSKEIYLLVVICITVVLASLSWMFIERKALAAKYQISEFLLSMRIKQ